MAEQMCNMIKTGGAGCLVYDLGTGTSFNISSMKGYQNLTIDNFVVAPPTGDSACAGNVDPNTGWLCGGYSVTRSYNSQTGVLSLDISASYSAGGYSGSSPKKSFHAYCIPNLNKVKSFTR